MVIFERSYLQCKVHFCIDEVLLTMNVPELSSVYEKDLSLDAITHWLLLEALWSGLVLIL